MIEITTGGRLHFGLLSPVARGQGSGVRGQGSGVRGQKSDGNDSCLTPDPCLLTPGLGRRFGGAGLMVERPGVRLRVSPAADWTAEGPLADRALAFARQFAASLPVAPQRLIVDSAPPAHAGLGSGTQLGMAVARALALAAGRAELSAEELARLVGRGRRSGLGVHGFARGGFLVDAGQKTEGTLAPLAARAAVPSDWRVVLVLPGASDWHGAREQEAFDRLSAAPTPVGATERLCRLVLLGLLPALAEADLDTFGECLYEFNTLAGEFFAAAQGGTYASPRVAELVAFLRQDGVRGAGQSSWGPAVFAVVGDPERAADLGDRLRQRFDLSDAQVISTPACNHGATESITPQAG